MHYLFLILCFFLVGCSSSNVIANREFSTQLQRTNNTVVIESYAANWQHVNVNWNIYESHVQSWSPEDYTSKPVESSYFSHYIFNDITANFKDSHVTITNNTPRKFSGINLLFKNKNNNYSKIIHVQVIVPQFMSITFFYEPSASLGSDPEIKLLDSNYNFNVSVKDFGTIECTPNEYVCKADSFQQQRYQTFQRNFKLVFNRPQITNEIRDFFVNKCKEPKCNELTRTEAKVYYAATNWVTNANLAKFVAHEAMNIYIGEGAASGDSMSIWKDYLSEPIISTSWYYNIYIHELFHTVGYDHASGMTYGWSDELENIIRNGALPNLNLDYVENQQDNLLIYVESIDKQNLKVDVRIVNDAETNIKMDLTSANNINIKSIVSNSGGFTIYFKNIPSSNILVNIYSNNVMHSLEISHSAFYENPSVYSQKQIKLNNSGKNNDVMKYTCKFERRKFKK